jgi:hypothetical protein
LRKDKRTSQSVFSTSSTRRPAVGDLKPCPFCADRGVVEAYLNVTTGLHDVVCRSCGIRMWIEKWEHRPIEDALRAEVAKLTAELERWKAPLIVDQVESVCAISQLDMTPEVRSRTASLDIVFRAVRQAGEPTERAEK